MFSQGFAPSSKLLQKRWDERQRKLHVRKLNSMKAGINNIPPKQYPHMVLRLKQVQREEQRKARIEHENLLLLQKMSVIMQHRGRVDNWNDYEAKSLNYLVREQEQDKIATQNIGMAKRLGAIKPMYAVDKWKDDFHKHEYYLGMWGAATKDFGISPRPKGTYYESDFEEDDNDKLPKIGNSRTSYDSRSESQKTDTLPLIHQNKNSKDTMTEADAKLLFRACTQLAKGDIVMLKTLIRRTHPQRIATKEVFWQLYDLDLASELAGAMGTDHEVLIECLLEDRSVTDAETIRKNTKENDVAGIVDILCSRKSQALADIKKTYKDEYNISMEDDIRYAIDGDDCQEFLIALSMSDRSKSERPDDNLAQKLADQLFDAGKGRFTEKNGKFITIIKEQSMPQIKAVFDCYKTVSEGHDIADSMQEDGCERTLVTAVRSLANCLDAKPMLFAEKLHEYMRKDQRQLIKLLLARAEIDMPTIRKSYRRKYGTDLVDDIIRQCGRAAPLIAQIATLPGAAGGQRKPPDHHIKRVNGIAIPQPPRKQPLRRPAAKRETEVSKNNPLGHSEKMVPSKRKTGQPVKKGRIHRTAEPVASALEEDARQMQEALDSWNVDQSPLVQMLSSRTCAQRRELQREYKRLYAKNLLKELEDVLSGDFAELLPALMLTPAEYDARCLRSALHDNGKGCHDSAVIDIIGTRTPHALSDVKSAYKATYGSDLVTDLRRNGGPLEELVVEIVQTEQSRGGDVYRMKAQTDAAQIREYGVTGDLFREVMSSSNNAQLKATAEEYEKLGYTLAESIKDAKLGQDEDAYLDLVAALSDSVEFHANQLNKASTDVMKNDSLIVRIIVSRAEMDLGRIKQRYAELTGKSLEVFLKNEFRADHANLLIAITTRK